MKLRVLCLSLALAVLPFLFARPAWAVSKFSADYTVLYDIQTSGTTVITQDINLRNLTATYYATEYSLSIGATKISNVTATDSYGNSLPVTVAAGTDSTTIRVTFSQQVVGLNRVLTFHLRYESNDIATRNGFVWEVTVPKLASSENINSYNLTLRAPDEIGSIASISPKPASTASIPGYSLFTFTKDQLANSGVNASFGDHQVFNFTLKYHLSNPRIFPTEEEIALPPDTETQTVTYTGLAPEPASMRVDGDGNYIATYRLPGNGKQDITLTGQAKIWNSPTNPPLENWTATDLQKYTVPDKYWESTFPAISAKAKELKTAQAIYDYVSTTLKYDYARAAGQLVRYGAAEAFQNPNSAVCMEYTDLFIAMARSVGIPARELDGYAYTNNAKLKPTSFSANGADTKTDILHAWPEYWNPDLKRWVQIDPTWASTTGGVDYFNKLDMNHFVFVIKGLSSVQPYPAGSYKTDPATQTNDVSVSVAPAETEITTQPSLSLAIGKKLIAGIPFGGQVIVSNLGNSTIFGGKLTIQSQVIKSIVSNLGPIPPFTNRAVDISGRTDNFNFSGSDPIQATLTGQSAKGTPVTISSEETVIIQPFLQVVWGWIVGLAAAVVLILIFLKLWPKVRPITAAKIPWLLKEPPPSD